MIASFNNHNPCSPHCSRLSDCVGHCGAQSAWRWGETGTAAPIQLTGGLPRAFPQLKTSSAPLPALLGPQRSWGCFSPRWVPHLPPSGLSPLNSWSTMWPSYTKAVRLYSRGGRHFGSDHNPLPRIAKHPNFVQVTMVVLQQSLLWAGTISPFIQHLGNLEWPLNKWS